MSVKKGVLLVGATSYGSSSKHYNFNIIKDKKNKLAYMHKHKILVTQFGQVYMHGVEPRFKEFHHFLIRLQLITVGLT